MKRKLPFILNFVFLIISALSFQLKAQTANFTPDKLSGCAPLTVTFTNTSTGSPTGYSWSFGNGNTSTQPNPGTTYLNPGTYTVTLTVAPSNNSTTKVITVNPKPTADFSAVTGACINQVIAFTDASTTTGGTITSWSWSFGDGSPLIATQNPAHTYTSAGSKQVSLTVTNNNGCSNSVTKSVSVLTKPVPDFSSTSTLNACAPPVNINFTNTSTGTGTLTYLWDFGVTPAVTSTLTNPSHNYTSLGNYNVKLVVSQGGCKDSITKSSFVNIYNTQSSFTTNDPNDSICVGGAIAFTNTSTPVSPAGTVTWDFGDGTAKVNTVNATHTYATAGTYTAQLITDKNGCKDTATRTIVVLALPTVAFTADVTQTCNKSLLVTFTDQSTPNNTYTWTFGDPTSGVNNTSTLQNPTHNYNSLVDVSYNVRLTLVSKVGGCSNSLTKNAYIRVSPPIPRFVATTPKEGCFPLNVGFSAATSTSAVDPIATYNWVFGDGNTATTNAPIVTTSNTYGSNNFFNVKLIVTTQTGCKDSIEKTKFVKAGTKPVADFTVIDPKMCYGDTAEFVDLSTAGIDPSAVPDSLFWNFGTGEKTMSVLAPTTAPVDYVYVTSGIFDVQLIAYNKGCADTLKKMALVTIDPPQPGISYTMDCAKPYEVKFVDASIQATSIKWDFGGGIADTSAALNPVYTFPSTGDKTIKLTARSSVTGCEFTVDTIVTITDSVAKYAVTKSEGCWPLTVTFSNLTVNTTSLNWKFGNNTNSNASQPKVVYNSPGSYSDTLVITDIHGCTRSKIDKTIVYGPVADFAADTTFGCAPFPVVFSDASASDSTLVQWMWDYGNGVKDTVTNSSHTYTYLGGGSFNVTLVSVDKKGCRDTLTKSNYIKPTKPTPKITITGTRCKERTITFSPTGSLAKAPATYIWDFDDTTSDTTNSAVSTTHVYTAEKKYMVTLTVKDSNKCEATLIDSVLIEHPKANMSTSVKKEICGESDIDFTDLSTGATLNVVGWFWDFGDGRTSTIQNPTNKYIGAGYYTASLVAINSAGCLSDTAKNDSIVLVPGATGTFTITNPKGCNPHTPTFNSIQNNAENWRWDYGNGTVTAPGRVTEVSPTYTSDTTAQPFLLLRVTLADSICELPAKVIVLDTANQDTIVTVKTSLKTNIDSTLVKLSQDEEFSIEPQVTGGYSNNSYNYSWVPAQGLSCSNCLSPLATGNGTGEAVTYTLTVRNGSCIARDTIKILYNYCENDEFIESNVFTPNGDGVNDLFKLKGICERNNYAMQIYDRWGVLMFSTKTRDNLWDGRTTSGQEASDGVYYYTIVFDNTDIKPVKGFLHLIR